MPRITGIRIGDLAFPFYEDTTSGYIIKKLTGIGDLSYEHAEVAYNEFFTHGGGRDITVVIGIKPTFDYHSVRRQIARVVPLDIDITLIVQIDFRDYAQTSCRVRNVVFDFSEKQPTVTLDLTSEDTCLKWVEAVSITGLPFGLSTQLPAITHDYTPAVVTIHLVSPMAAWYRIYLSSDYLSINTSILAKNCGIEEIPEDTTIEIDSNDETFGVYLVRPTFPDAEKRRINIETACELGEAGFKFIPNEPMIVQTTKIPSGLSGERIDLTCFPLVSGV